MPVHKVTLREYVDERFNVLNSSIRREREASEETNRAYREQLRIASDALSIRLEHMNEWRKDYDAQRVDYATRLEIDDKLRTITVPAHLQTERINAIDKKLSNLEGRVWAFGLGSTLFLVALQIALHFLK